ncbi:excalibur calcium-binding domain-containing protein [Mycolicibacterium grossiae]|uniref:excalibur calcium-binding domain-containing protein n=1 Tax=Mycolicibacterium grossiae TaxID=1552759 RepID=UPI0009F55EFC|nr:excalibur calcium-binding domain-containing protein [Mycolicibacterium grossiae]QEM43568.1 excalibur calcium-binding domain-containing protein [Mycolicibacterium grossiae]
MLLRAVVVFAASSAVALGSALAASADAPYKNCSEARANGDTDIPSDSPNYGPWLDKDRDGVGCES